MALDAIDLHDWFPEITLEEEDKDDADMQAVIAVGNQLYAELRRLGEVAISEVRQSPSAAEVALDRFYRAWQAFDSDQSTETRESVHGFIKQVVEDSGSGLDPEETMANIDFELVGAKLRPQSLLAANISDAELKETVAWIQNELVTQKVVAMPGLINIKARKNSYFEPGNGEPQFIYSYSGYGELFEIPVDFEGEDEQELGVAAPAPAALAKFCHAVSVALLADSEPLKVDGVGIFIKKVMPSYDGRNPRTGDVIKVPGKNVVNFKVSIELKKLVDPSR